MDGPVSECQPVHLQFIILPKGLSGLAARMKTNMGLWFWPFLFEKWGQTAPSTCSLEYSYSLSVFFFFFYRLSLPLPLPVLSGSLCLRQLCSLTLDVIIFVLVSYCWHFNSGAPQSGLTQTARNHTSQPFRTAALVASNFSQIKGLFYLVVFFTQALYREKTNQTARLWFAGC